MPLSRKYRINLAVSGIAATLAFSSGAHAQLVTRFTTYMHSGPGLQYSVTDEIPIRTPFTPEACNGGWCRVLFGGIPGWIQQNTLISGPSTAEPKPGEHPVECMDFARTGWPDAGNLERVCIFAPVKPLEIEKPAG